MANIADVGFDQDHTITMAIVITTFDVFSLLSILALNLKIKQNHAKRRGPRLVGKSEFRAVAAQLSAGSHANTGVASRTRPLMG